MMYNPSRTQNVKEGAYLDYFRYFSISALETTRKLQSTFQDEFEDELLFNSHHMFKLIKKLLSAYEVLVLEINDSCQFVQIPEFGVCIMKIFFQLMSIIRFLIKGVLKKNPIERLERQKRPEQRFTMIIPSPSPEHSGQVSELVERQSMRVRENAAHIFKDLTQQVKTLQKQHKANIQQSQNTIQKIHKGREKLQGIESSQSETVLAEAVTLLFRRGQHINNFLNLLQGGQIIKEQPEAYSKLRQKMEEDNVKRIETAKEKLNSLFITHVTQVENKKKAAMISQEVQTNFEQAEGDEMVKKRKSAHRKTHIDQNKKLKLEISELQQENQALRQYIRSKIEQQENDKTKIIAQKILLETRLAASENRRASQKSKGSLDKKSFSNLDACESIQNLPEVRDLKSHLSIENDFKEDQLMRSTFKQTKVKIPKIIKSRVKFQPQSFKLQLCSKQMEQTYFHEGISFKYPEIGKQPQQIPKIEEPIQRSSHNEQEEHQKCQQLLNIADQSDMVLLKITSPLIHTNTQVEQWSEKDNIRYSQKEGSNIRVKKAQVKCNSSENPPNQGKRVRSQKINSKLLKKQSILQFIQDRQSKMISDFSQASCIKQYTSKESIKSGDKQNQEQRKEAKKPSRFNQKDSGSNANQALQVFNSEPSPTKFQEISLVPFKESLSFEQEDLPYIFINEENAKNYEFLNLSLVSKQKKYISAVGGKTVLKAVKNLKSKPETQTVTPEHPNNIENTDFLIGLVFEVLTFLKKDKKNYRTLCNFLRYPYSCIYYSDSASWKVFQKQQEPLDYLQLRKLLTRIMKLHAQCGQPLCCHWRYFLTKIGVQLQ